MVYIKHVYVFFKNIENNSWFIQNYCLATYNILHVAEIKSSMYTCCMSIMECFIWLRRLITYNCLNISFMHVFILILYCTKQDINVQTGGLDAMSTFYQPTCFFSLKAPLKSARGTWKKLCLRRRLSINGRIFRTINQVLQQKDLNSGIFLFMDLIFDYIKGMMICL